MSPALLDETAVGEPSDACSSESVSRRANDHRHRRLLRPHRGRQGHFAPSTRRKFPRLMGRPQSRGANYHRVPFGNEPGFLSISPCLGIEFAKAQTCECLHPGACRGAGTLKVEMRGGRDARGIRPKTDAVIPLRCRRHRAVYASTGTWWRSPRSPCRKRCRACTGIQISAGERTCAVKCGRSRPRLVQFLSG